MEIINLCENNSLVGHFMSEIRDKEIQQDRLRFRANVHRLGQIFFDKAENGFVSAYRKYDAHDPNKFDVKIEYLACPDITDKVLFIVDPMLATGLSMALAYKALLSRGTPKHVHMASIIATDQAIDFIEKNLPNENLTVWACDIDHELNEHSYIVPGLGDAGDLVYGEKL